MHHHVPAMTSRADAAPGTRNIALDMLITRDGRPKYLIAAMAGMPSNTFSGIVRGRLYPTESAKARIAEVLGSTVAEAFPTHPAPR